MDRSEQQGNEAHALGATSEALRGADAQEVRTGPGDSPDPEQAPPKAPRKRRTASAPAGAPPAAPLIAAPPIDAPLIAATPATGDVPTPGADPTTGSDTDPGSGAAPVGAAPVRKRATRSRKPGGTVVTDPTDSAVGVGTPVSDEAAAAGPEPTPGTGEPARAPRTRRRAATAEAGPAAPVEIAVIAPVVPAAPIGAADMAVAPVPPADDATGTPAASAATPPARAVRSRRRAATAEAGPAVVADPPAISTPAAVTPDQDATDQGATGQDATDRRSADAPVEQGPTGPAGPTGPTAAPEESPARSRRTTGDRSRSRSRRASEPAPADTDATLKEDTDAAGAVTGTARVDTAPAPADEIRGTTDDAAAEQDADDNRFDPFAVPESPLSLLFHAPDLTTTTTTPSVKVTSPVQDEEEDDESEEGRRSRRSRRGRSRGRTTGGGTTDRADGGSGDVDRPADDDDTTDRGNPQRNGPDDGPGVTSRRRRRRRRGDQDLELTGGEDDDPPNTVTRVRAPRQSAEPASDGVTGVRGSTRLEAKKQRRRDSRDTGRRRQIITEAEFLARRESVDRQMIVRQRDDRIQIGVLEDGILGEHFVSRTQQDSLIGNVYLGKVQNVLPSMEAAFIDIGRGRNAVLYAGEVNWDAAGLDGRPRRIELALKSGDPVLVQVTKDPVGHKGARLTSQISLPGRYLVYVPGSSMTGISRKLPDVERNRLKRILKDRLPENAGVIVRTAAEGASEEELTHDINRLRAQWEEIERKAGSTKILAPELLYGEPDLTIKVVRDVFNEDFSKLVVSGEEAWDTIEAYVMYVAPDLVDRLEKWTAEEDIFAASRIDEQIAKALERKVFLPSGGSLVIDRTEAMTVVDVNTGKFTGSGGNLEETVTKNNLEAAEEVVRQLRLRDIGGIIVIDFIDMVLEANRDLVLRRLVECLGRDRTKHQVAEVTSLGLVQMTRKRMGTGLLEVFGEDCEHCAGRGVVTYMEPVEHSHVPTSEMQQQPRQERPSRSERKRGRGRGGQQDEGFAPIVAVAPVIENPDRAAKAEAARAALASIAAATHHAHEGAADVPAVDADVQVTEAVLTINGETVTLPRADARRPAARRPERETAESVPAPTTRLTLDSLSEAFNRRTPAAGGAASDGGAAAGEQETVAPVVVRPSTADPVARATVDAPAAVPARRPGRRVARSAQGAADTSIETVASEDAEQPSGTRHTVTARPVTRRTESAAEPLIFGVGVPASEL